MQECLRAALVCSAGLCFSYGGSSILVDALNAAIRSFKVIPPETARQIIAGAPPYDRVDGLFYSHQHPDHCDPEKNAAFLRNHPGVRTFLPTAETADRGVIRAGAFTVEYGYLEHTPCDYEWAKHYVLLISAGGTTVYLATDADLAPAGHRAFLAGRRADYGFFNAMYLSYPETRALLREAASRTYIYHMPEPAADASGICRKAERNFARFPEELRGVTVLDRYPTELLLPPRPSL